MFVVPKKLPGRKGKKSPVSIIKFLMVNANLCFYPPVGLSPYAVCLHGALSFWCSAKSPYVKKVMFDYVFQYPDHQTFLTDFGLSPADRWQEALYELETEHFFAKWVDKAHDIKGPKRIGLIKGLQLQNGVRFKLSGDMLAETAKYHLRLPLPLPDGLLQDRHAFRLMLYGMRWSPQEFNMLPETLGRKLGAGGEVDLPGVKEFLKTTKPYLSGVPGQRVYGCRLDDERGFVFS